MAPQLTGTKGPEARLDRRWIERATISLPLPDGPWIKTVEPSGATLPIISDTFRIAGLGKSINREKSCSDTQYL
jgi:hypothetical protein